MRRRFFRQNKNIKAASAKMKKKIGNVYARNGGSAMVLCEVKAFGGLFGDYALVWGYVDCA